MNEEYLYIFDYDDCQIYEIKLKEEDSEKSTDDILRAFNMNIDNCSVMFSNSKCKIKNITKQRDE